MGDARGEHISCAAMQGAAEVGEYVCHANVKAVHLEL